MTSEQKIAMQTTLAHLAGEDPARDVVTLAKILSELVAEIEPNDHAPAVQRLIVDQQRDR